MRPQSYCYLLVPVQVSVTDSPTKMRSLKVPENQEAL